MPSRPATAAGSRTPAPNLEINGKGGPSKVASKSSLSRLERLKRHQEIIRRCSNELGICLEGSTINAATSVAPPPLTTHEEFASESRSNSRNESRQNGSPEYHDPPSMNDVFNVLPHFGEQQEQQQNSSHTAEGSTIVEESALFPGNHGDKSSMNTSNVSDLDEAHSRPETFSTDPTKFKRGDGKRENVSKNMSTSSKEDRESAIEVATRLVAKFARATKEDSISTSQKSISASPEYDKKYKISDELRRHGRRGDDKSAASHLSGSVEGILKKWRNKYDEFIHEGDISIVSGTSDESSRAFDPDDVFREDPALVRLVKLKNSCPSILDVKIAK